MVVITSWPKPVPLAVTSLLLTKLRGALKWVETATAYAAVSKADGSRVHALSVTLARYPMYDPGDIGGGGGSRGSGGEGSGGEGALMSSVVRVGAAADSTVTPRDAESEAGVAACSAVSAALAVAALGKMRREATVTLPALTERETAVAAGKVERSPARKADWSNASTVPATVKVEVMTGR
jgi:hypothetical protein